eukprot:scaffold182395_cov66-Cyclotella_meneghiniana.AAC.1
MGGDIFRSSTLHCSPRLCGYGLIKEYHSILTLPTSHYKYRSNVAISINRSAIVPNQPAILRGGTFILFLR